MSTAAVGMDRMYRHQRHLYDLTRKFYLLGRDPLLERLSVPPGGCVLEIACGTGRNLVAAARRYPTARLCGLDVSAVMLRTAAATVRRAKLAERIQLAPADATAFDPQALFGVAAFDRIVISYALSMIPAWEAVLAAAAKHLRPGGTLFVVDFGDGADLPGPVRRARDRWLALFGVSPRADLPEALATLAAAGGLHARTTPLYRGYAVHGELSRSAA